ncbi:MAG: type II and III secretion system protein family protein [Proteobacteria bacterium]|nr:type II and III secretion system protein family protein [Pseudomonadota bacterium]
MSINSAEVIKFEKPVTEIFIANPDVADVQLSNKNSAYVFGKSPGMTKLFAMGEKGQEVLNADIYVSYNLSQLREMIAIYDPHGLVEVTAIAGGILLEGPVDSPEVAENIRSLAERYVQKALGGASQGGAPQGGSQGSSSSTQGVINRLTIKPPVQVNLRVKVAEVERNVLNELGFDWQAVVSNAGTFKFGALANRAPFTALPIATNNVNSITQPQTIVPGENVSSLGFGYVNSHVNINAAIDLLAQDGFITILAEPNLVAVSGETASFLAGGEFPYPIPQQFGNITIDFKQYGVSLAFTPTVLDGNLISMRVRPEVSELDPLTGISVQGVSVPGILTRRAETTIQLGSGQTFAIAGLLKNTVRSQIAALPGLGDIPILGALFRSNSFQRGDTELVILVTPYLVEPVSGKEMSAPTDGINYATFLEQVFERRLIKPNAAKGKSPAFGPGGLRLMGPAGFSVD